MRAEELGAATHDDDTVGSHRDLNAHNVLFDGDSLVLIDWDAAGPASPRFERAGYATLWAQTPDGRHDRNKTIGFLRGYTSAGGTVTSEDVAILPQWLTGVSWWTEQNVRAAVAQTTAEQDNLAAILVRALIEGAQTVQARQELLATATANL